MTNENFERRMELLAEEQVRFAARMAEVEEIIVAFRRVRGVRSKASDSRVGENVRTADEPLCSLIAEMERCFSKGRNQDSNDNH